MELKFEFDTRELEKNLLSLDQKIAVKYARDAGKEAMKPVRDEIEANANEDVGILKGAIKLRTSKAKGRSRGSKNRFLAIRAGVFTRKGSEERRRNQAALAQEYGNSRQEAEPFIRPALKNNAQKVLNTFTRVLGNKIKGHK